MTAATLSANRPGEASGSGRIGRMTRSTVTVDRSRQAVATLSTTATELLGVVDRFRH